MLSSNLPSGLPEVYCMLFRARVLQIAAERFPFQLRFLLFVRFCYQEGPFDDYNFTPFCVTALISVPTVSI